MPDHIEEVYACLCIAIEQPESPLSAKIRGWKYPASRAELHLIDLINTVGTAFAGRDWEPVKGPANEPAGERFGRSNLSPEEARERLRQNARGV